MEAFVKRFRNVNSWLRTTSERVAFLSLYGLKLPEEIPTVELPDGTSAVNLPDCNPTANLSVLEYASLKAYLLREKRRMGLRDDTEIAMSDVLQGARGVCDRELHEGHGT